MLLEETREFQILKRIKLFISSYHTDTVTE